MSAVLDAIEVIKTHVVPSEEKLQGYRSAIDRHCEEKSQWRRRAEDAEKQVSAVKGTLRKLGYQDGYDLGSRVESAILEPRYQLEQELKQARYNARSLDEARHDLRHHATSLCQLYNKAAGHVLFGHGDPPNLMELRMAIDAAIEAAVQERVKTITTKETT